MGCQQIHYHCKSVRENLVQESNSVLPTHTNNLKPFKSNANNVYSIYANKLPTPIGIFSFCRLYLMSTTPQLLPKSLCALSCNSGQNPVSKLAGLGFLGMCGSGWGKHTEWLERFWPWGSDTFSYKGMNRDVTLSCGYLKAASMKWEFIAQILESRARAKMKQEKHTR